ncbi:MAG: redoxin domain-containing protein [Bacteroidota bacterium]|nr:redoxin domain-containing protein [Bacteroidota bacterium]
MKRNFAILSILFFAITTCAFAGKDAYNIKLKIKGSKDSVLYLGTYFMGKQYIKDTARIDQAGYYTFKGKEKLDYGLYLVASQKKVILFDIILTEDFFSLETDTTDYIKNMVVKGSAENTLFFNFLNYIGKKQSEIGPLSKELKSAKDKKDSVKVKEIEKKLNAVDKEVKDYKLKFMKDNPKSFVSKIFNTSREPEIPDYSDKPKKEQDSLKFVYYKTHFFDYVDFSDERLLRTPVFHSKITQYLDQLTIQSPDSINAAADYLINKCRANKEVFKYCVQYITNNYESSNVMGYDAIAVHMYRKYYTTKQAFWADSVMLYKITDRANIMEPLLIGKQCPTLVVMDTLAEVDIDKRVLTKPGNYHSLYDFKAKYTVLVFWDPDCGHCKTAIPKLRDEYKKIKALGGDVFAVTTESDTKKWKKFIIENKLPWFNGFDPGNENKIHTRFDIYSTPVIYILDEKKVIVAKRVGVEQVVDVIDKIDKFKK